MHDARVADDKAAALDGISAAGGSVLAGAAHNVKQFKHIVMLVDQLGMILWYSSST